ncbi:MAG: hypothetical protein ACR2OZ_04290 [Verrucomicrobiales bacterium]
MSQKSRNETTIVCPAETSWDLWRQGSSGFERAASIPLEEGGGPASFKAAQIFGCPITSAFAVPLWVASTDPEIIDSAVAMQLEKMNLRSDEGGGRLVESQVIEQAENQTLVFVTVLNERNLREFPRQSPSQFEVTPSLFYLADNSLTLWNELGKLVATFTRGDRVIYFQALGSATLGAEAIHEIKLLLMQLDLQEVLGELESAVLWTDAVEPGAEVLLREELGVRVVREPKPAPVPPPRASPLLPNQIAAARQTAARRRRIRRMSMAGAAVYLMAAGLFAFFCLKEVKAAHDLKKRSSALENEAGWVAPEQQRWVRMLDVTHADRYPIERFYQVTKTLDESSKVRLTKFTFEPHKLIIAGEAQDVTKAINYMNAITRDPTLAEYSWDKNPPKTEKTGIASFQMTGTLKNAPPDNK